MEFVKFCMDFCTLVWNLLILVWIIRLLDFCMKLFVEEETINPLFFFFFMNLGLKEPYLVYWLCFGLGLVDCNPQLRNICIKEILGF